MATHHKQKLVAVLVPFYQSCLTADEELSLRHLRHFLGDYDKYLVSPRSLDPNLPDFEVMKFKDKYFTSVYGYSRLMLSADFYRTFVDYEYILIYQLDALVFSDQLTEWCRSDFDYVGAPWLKNQAAPTEGFAGVGNGGLSLRKVQSMLHVLRSPGVVIDAKSYWEEFCGSHSRWEQTLNLHKKYLKRLSIFNGVSWYSRHPYDFEDVFWSKFASTLWPEFKLAPIKAALNFSFELAPRYCFEQNGYQLPFGCHAWNKYDREFWEPYLLH